MKQAAEKLKLWAGCRGLHPRLQGQTDRARVQMEEQADIRTTVKQVDRKMGCLDSRDRVKVNSSYEMTDRLMGGAVMAGPGPGPGVRPFLGLVCPTSSWAWFLDVIFMHPQAPTVSVPISECIGRLPCLLE